MANIEITQVVETVTVTVVHVERTVTVTSIREVAPFGFCDDCGSELEAHCMNCTAVFCEWCEYGDRL